MDRRPVAFGVFDHLDRGPGSLQELYEERLRVVEAYDRAGFYAYHLAEHHGRPVGMAPSPSVFLAALTQRTKHIRLAPLVYLLPFYHPLRLIEEVCMLDQLSGGRLELGTGRGVLTMEAKFYGLDPQELGPRYDEALQILRLGLAGEDSLSFDGRFYQFHAYPLELHPLQRPFPALWYGVHGPESATRAARAGFNVVTNEGTVAAHGVAEAALAVRDPGTRVGIVRFITVAKTDVEAHQIAKHAYARWHESFFVTQRRLGVTTPYQKSADIDAAIAEGTALIGSPSTVRNALALQIRTTGVDYVLGQFAYGDQTLAQTLQSIELFTREVMPSFTGELASRTSLRDRG
jgi:alkanesulfonate monooxygenase SsuD/methylene tetrahydromethanopterin reductase-like flavin-dependent oxidoreductase (luciferase family)